jgi:hypothetical protein
LNLVYLFLVHRLFPESKIIFMLRDPRDACLSCFFQAFDLQGAMPYFLDLGQTVGYYNEVMSLATETCTVITNPRTTVRYEDLVVDFEQSLRSLIRFLGLDWSSDVMAYREKSRQRVISTPSYQQVVQPLYTQSLGRWKKFLPFAETEFESLGQWVRRFGYSTGQGRVQNEEF